MSEDKKPINPITRDEFVTLLESQAKEAEAKKEVSSKKTPKRKKAKVSVDDFLAMPKWVDLEGGVFMNVTRDVLGKRIERTVFYEKDNVRLLEEVQFVPPDTQPSPGFMDTTMTMREVFESLVKKYRKYIHFQDRKQYMVLALAAMSTYFREAFDSYPYIDFYAAERNCGKTTAMECLILASYHGFLPVDPTGPVLFRAIDSCKSAIGIDEIDNLMGDHEGKSRILGILNSAYSKGKPAYRIDMDKNGLPIAFDPFGLKAFTHTGPIPEALRSRSITIPMMRNPKNLPAMRGAPVFKEERDNMYRLRLEMGEQVEKMYVKVLDDIDLTNRGRQLFIPLLTMAKLIGEVGEGSEGSEGSGASEGANTFFSILLRWAKKYIDVFEDQDIDEIKSALVETLMYNIGEVKAQKITEDLNQRLLDRGLIVWPYTSKKVIGMLQSLNILKTSKKSQGYVHIDVKISTLIDWVRLYKLEDEVKEGTLLHASLSPQTSLTSPDLGVGV